MMVTSRPASAAWLRIRFAVGGSVVGTVASTPIVVPVSAALRVIASSILTIGMCTWLLARSIAGPSEEHAEKITSAPARSAASARCAIRASLSSLIEPSRITVARHVGVDEVDHLVVGHELAEEVGDLGLHVHEHEARVQHRDLGHPTTSLSSDVSGLMSDNMVDQCPKERKAQTGNNGHDSVTSP